MNNISAVKFNPHVHPDIISDMTHHQFPSEMIKNIILLCGNSMSASDVSEVFSKYFCKPLIEPKTSK